MEGSASLGHGFLANQRRRWWGSGRAGPLLKQARPCIIGLSEIWNIINKRQPPAGSPAAAQAEQVLGAQPQQQAGSLQLSVPRLSRVLEASTFRRHGSRSAKQHDLMSPVCSAC